MSQFNKPVALIFFNRPGWLSQVFEQVKKVQPRQLFLICDGPRADNPNDAAAIQRCREIVADVNWECEIQRNYSDVNLGCKNRISSGLDWLFEQAEEAIILEDDCVPDPSFFPYCAELLDFYADDEKVMHISGTNNAIPKRKFPGSASYAFSRYALVWGWATWRRAWQLRDMDLVSLDLNSEKIDQWYRTERASEYWRMQFNRVLANDVDAWDYPWNYSMIAPQGMSIIPRNNMVSNIGFGAGATHTHSATDRNANLPTTPTQLPLVHPKNHIHSDKIDDWLQSYNFCPSKKTKKIRKLKKSFLSLVNGDKPDGTT